MTRDQPPRRRASLALTVGAILATVPLAWLVDHLTGLPADAGQVMLFAALPIALVVGLLVAHRGHASGATATSPSMRRLLLGAAAYAIVYPLAVVLIAGEVTLLHGVSGVGGLGAVVFVLSRRARSRA